MFVSGLLAVRGIRVVMGLAESGGGVGRGME